MHIEPQRHPPDHTHVWADARERADAHRLTPWGKRIYKRRKETVERSFADAKQLHGHRYARFRGLVAVACQCLLAAAQNIKKIALALTPKPFQHQLDGGPTQTTTAEKQNPAEKSTGFVSGLRPPFRRSFRSADRHQIRPCLRPPICYPSYS
jgi:hypothetical protein